jgi:hypothetical protein
MLLIGFVVNLIIFPLNHITAIVVNHGDYTPFAVVPQVSALVYDEAQFYVPGPSRFFRTGQVPAEVDVYELRDVPSSPSVLHSILLGALAKGVGSLEWAWMISHAIMPALIWALLFWNARRFLRSDAIAVVIAWTVCFAAFGPRNFLLLSEDSFRQPLELTRMPQPGLSFLFLILSIWLFCRVLVRPTLMWIFAAAITAGALFYLYYYYWIAFFAGAGSLFIVVVIINRWDCAKTIASILLLGCLTGIPFFLWTVQGMRSGHPQELMLRQGNFTTAPDLIGLLLALTLVVSLWLYCKLQIRESSDEQAIFGAVLLAVITGAALGLNAQALTGINAEHAGHFYNRVLQPLGTYFLLLMVFRNVRRPVTVVTVLVSALLISMAAVRQVQVGRNTAAYHRITDPDMEVLLWARSHLPADVVIGSNDGNLLTLIPAIAGTWTFVPLGDRSMASDKEILTRYLLLCRLEGRTWYETEMNLKSDLGFKSLVYRRIQ